MLGGRLCSGSKTKQSQQHVSRQSQKEQAGREKVMDRHMTMESACKVEPVVLIEMRCLTMQETLGWVKNLMGKCGDRVFSEQKVKSENL